MKNQRQNKFLGYLKFVPQTKKVEDKKPLPKVNEKIGKYELKQEPKVIEKKIMISDGTTEVGSETGIEEDYQNQIPRKNCEVCDD